MDQRPVDSGLDGAPRFEVAAEPDQPALPARRLPGGLSRRTATALTAAGLVAGGVVGGYVVSHAAASGSPATLTAVSAATGSSSSSGSAASSATSSSSASSTESAESNESAEQHGGHIGTPATKAEDDQQIADAIGISLTQLQTEEKAGSTIAAIAKAHSVDAQKVIDTLVAAENKEVDAAVTAGTITKAQGDTEKANQVARITAEVNNTDRSGPGGGHGGPGGGHPPNDTDDGSSSSSSSSSSTGSA